MMNLKPTNLQIVLSIFALTGLAILACGSATPQVNTPTVPPPEGQPSNTGAPPTEPQELPTAAPTATVTPKPLGSARSNPAPVGSEVVMDDMAISVTEVISHADDLVAKGNMFNPKAEAGSHYLFANMSVTCQKSSDESCSLTGLEFSVIDSAGLNHDAELVMAGVSGMLESGEFYGGAKKAGYVAFIVPDNDSGLILKYSGFLSLSGDAYLALQ
jgi:hypothetical protein